MISIKATVGDVSHTIDYKVDFVNPCEAQPLTLLTPQYFQDHTHILGDVTHSQTWTAADLVTIDSELECGDFLVEFMNSDMTPLDPELFEIDYDSMPHKLSVLETAEVLKEG